MTGPEIGGGGSVAVETDAMLRASAILAGTGERLAAVEAGVAACSSTLPPSPRRTRTDEALQLVRRARSRSVAAADGLRIAATRYGLVEHAVLAMQERLAADAAAGLGRALALALPGIGPLGILMVGVAAIDVVRALVVFRTLQRFVATGLIAPQTDPVLIRALALALGSIDDAMRGSLLLQQVGDPPPNDATAPYGVETVAAVLAAALLHPAGARLSVTPSHRREVRAPADLAALADRIPHEEHPTSQIRVERYGGEGGTRWIVYIAGTVTFWPESGDQPFDLASDVLGVAHRPSDSERAVLQAMQDAGVGTDEPVLLVGHSQGALDAVRVAQDGGYLVGGVVGFGGPTGQIAVPGDVPVLAVEHDEDIVPALGGTAAGGAAGLGRLVVRRSLPDAGFGQPTSKATALFPAHDLGAYRRTVAAAQASGDVRLQAFTDRIGPFLEGDGTATRYRARRVSPVPAPTAAAGPDRPPRR